MSNCVCYWLTHNVLDYKTVAVLLNVVVLVVVI